MLATARDGATCSTRSPRRAGRRATSSHAQLAGRSRSARSRSAARRRLGLLAGVAERPVRHGAGAAGDRRQRRGGAGDANARARRRGRRRRAHACSTGAARRRTPAIRATTATVVRASAMAAGGPDGARGGGRRRSARARSTSHDVATALAAYPVDAKARLLALVAKRAGDEAMRAKLLAELLSATHETAVVGDRDHELRRGRAHAAACRTRRPPRSRSTRSCARRPSEADHHQARARPARRAPRAAGGCSTQENVAVLIAMRRYFDTYEKATPDFTGKLWLGGIGYAEHAFAGRTIDRAAAAGRLAGARGRHDPRPDVREGRPRPHVLPRRHHVRAEAHRPAAARRRLRRAPRLRGGRRSEDVIRGADGRLARQARRARAGHARGAQHDAALRRRARRSAARRASRRSTRSSRWPSARRPVPTTGGVEPRQHARRARRGVRARATRAPHFAYSVRATTPGMFVAAPAKAEEMYAPETFGRTASRDRDYSIVTVPERGVGSSAPGAGCTTTSCPCTCSRSDRRSASTSRCLARGSPRLRGGLELITFK